MRWSAHGHPAIRATHTKTLELVADASITARATCVVGVRATPAPAAPMAGPVAVTISAGGQEITLTALANPEWDPRGAAVIRRSPLRLPGTFATHADLAASDLPRELVAALQDPATAIDVRVEPITGGSPSLVLFAADPARPDDPRLTAELDAADTVIAEDDAARRLVDGRAPSPAAGRTLLVATADLPGATGSPLPTEWPLPGARSGRPTGKGDRFPNVETVGLAPRFAVACACPSRAPVTYAPHGTDPRVAVRTTPSANRLVLDVRHDRFDDLLALAAAERGTGAAIVGQQHGPPMFAAPGALPDLANHGHVSCCLYPAEPSPADDVLDPPVRAAVRALLTNDVATKTAAAAVAELTGWPRRRAYAAVVEMATRSRSDHAGPTPRDPSAPGDRKTR